MRRELGKGYSYPLGATLQGTGANFSIYSAQATSMELLLFDSVDAQGPSQTFSLSPQENRTFHYWHAFVPGVKAGQLYGYRAYGPFIPEQGLRFDGWKVLVDPYARAIAIGDNFDRMAAIVPGDNVATCMKSVVVDSDDYDWEGDKPLHRPFYETVIYELHVRGFTRHPSSGVAAKRRGTYAGLIERIPYLQDLGITAVELLPVQQFDSHDVPNGLTNYWGYNTIGFFAPHHAYSSQQSPLGPVSEFRDMVKALHRAGIEVILDVVYNHTAEGNHQGPTFSFRGLADQTYYILTPHGAHYANFSGTGNTLNANHSVVRRMILDSLRYWVQEMHVDGFRFDLASVLSRDQMGHPLSSPPILWSIESDPVLAGTKIIAEAWDAAGLYQVGSFIGERWKEWNGRYRDDVRSFVKGDGGVVRQLADRLLGSPDIYRGRTHELHRSVNFVTCHDGFTLNDLVSFNDKHNLANREGNCDGDNNNRSWNSGVEGPSDDPGIEALRLRQTKNFLTILTVSMGTPMIFMGDEMRRTQHGNNNAYCQDSELTWLDWNLLQRNADLHQFVKGLLKLRRRTDDQPSHNALSLSQVIANAHITWHGVRLGKPDWSETSRCLAMSVQNSSSGNRMHLILNAFWEPLLFELPPLPGGPGVNWRRVIDTALASPMDLCEPEEAPLVNGHAYFATARSVVMLWAPAVSSNLASRSVDTLDGAEIDHGDIRTQTLGPDGTSYSNE